MVGPTLRLVAIGLVGLALQGCAALTTFNVSRPADPAGSLTFLDAKQRMILTGVRPDMPGQLIHCAEPSPDALSSIAASQTVSLTGKAPVSLSEAASLSEGAASIGLRTQSIQLMRDAMYRICEGYAAGALDAASYETLYRRLESSMVAVLAIEQLTGAVKAAPVVLGGSGAVGDSQAAADLTAKTQQALVAMRQAEADAAQADAQLATLTTAEATAAAELKTATDANKADDIAADKAKLATATKAVDDQTKLVADKAKLKTDSEALYAKIDAARAVALAGSTAVRSTGSASPSADASVANGEAVKSVADAVTAIVNETLGLSFSRELCTTVLSRTDSEGLNKDVVTGCLTFLKSSIDALAAYQQQAAVAQYTPQPMAQAQAQPKTGSAHGLLDPSFLTSWRGAVDVSADPAPKTDPSTRSRPKPPPKSP